MDEAFRVPGLQTSERLDAGDGTDMDRNEGLAFAKAFVDAQHAGRYQPLDVGGHQAFAIHGAASLSILGPKITSRPEPFLSLLCGVATSMPLTPELYELVNVENKEAFFGSCFVEAGNAGTLEATTKPRAEVNCGWFMAGSCPRNTV